MAKGLDGRGRDRDGEIRLKRADAKNKNLPKPILEFPAEMTIGEMRRATGKESEAAIRRAAKKLHK